jgi:uncharacterized protein YvpB
MSITEDELRALRKMIIDDAESKCAYIDSIIAGLAQPVGRRLAVPWVSQLGPGADFAPGDCGPACLAMWLRWLGKGPVTVDQVSAQVNLRRGYRYTKPAHLIRAARAWGVDLYWRYGLSLDDLRAEIDWGQPAIVLAHYPFLPLRYDMRYSAGHWILVNGYSEDKVVYLDPYFQTGGEVDATIDTFMRAWGSNHIDGNSDYQALRIR